MVEQSAEQIGLAGMSIVGGALSVALYFIYIATEKPRGIDFLPLAGTLHPKHAIYR